MTGYKTLEICGAGFRTNCGIRSHCLRFGKIVECSQYIIFEEREWGRVRKPGRVLLSLWHTQLIVTINKKFIVIKKKTCLEHISKLETLETRSFKASSKITPIALIISLKFFLPYITHGPRVRYVCPNVSNNQKDLR